MASSAVPGDRERGLIAPARGAHQAPVDGARRGACLRVAVFVVGVALCGASAQAGVTVTGSFLYRDEDYATAGTSANFTTSDLEPIRRVLVRLLTPSNSLQATSSTDESGNYSAFHRDATGEARCRWQQ